MNEERIKKYIRDTELSIAKLEDELFKERSFLDSLLGMLTIPEEEIEVE